MWTPILTATLVIGLLALAAGLVLTGASRRLPADPGALVDQVNDLLPQTQCAQCGYPGCRPYAQAIVAVDAPLNLCPPGGEETVRRLADLLGREPADVELPAPYADGVALIDESRCIGCGHCSQACPVDAITGAHQYMHTVIAAECTGCELCVAPCPVDCIDMVART